MGKPGVRVLFSGFKNKEYSVQLIGGLKTPNKIQPQEKSSPVGESIGSGIDDALHIILQNRNGNQLPASQLTRLNFLAIICELGWQ